MAQQKAVETPVEELEDLVDELQPGTKLLKGQYTITRYLNSGGFGITYLAKDSLDRDVVIKECFPSSFCRRSKTLVAARSRAHTAELRSVVQLFVKEARSLAKIVHPNIVAVHQVFEDNGTAYMAIDFVDGLDLQQIIDGQGKLPTPEEIVVITEKLLHAVGFIHSNDMLHRDISPDNILVSKDGEPVLIDFGAAREQASQTNRAMSALRVVKDGYSPQEFYIAGSEQGPWSDLYALGATLYHLISGEAPVNGQARLAALAEDRDDPYVPLDGRFQGYPPGFLRAIDVALNTLPKQRTQSAAEWLTMFSSTSSPAFASTRSTSKDPVEDAVLKMVQSSRLAEANAAPQAAAAAPADFGAPPNFVRKVSQPAGKPRPASEAQPAQAARSGVGMVQVAAGIAVALALVGGGLILFGGSDPAPSENTAAVDQQAPAETAAQSVAPAETPATSDTAAAAETPAETETAALTPEPATEPATEPSVEPVAATTEETTEAAPEPAIAPETPEPPVVAAAPAGDIRDNQISFAAWDAEIPFLDDNRMISGQRRSIVLRIPPSTDLQEAGNWLAPGLILYTINGMDIQQNGGFASALLRAMNVDPDGKARVVVEYAGSSLERQTGLLTVSASRLVSLANGISVTARMEDGEWRTVVTSVANTAVTDLREGDVLFRDKMSDTPVDGPRSLEAIMETLVKNGVAATEFSIIRNRKVASASMQLAMN
ncbi:MAG: protein kinase [Tabrizicola sp.]|nr:protein kinase [Tabrizicola sp.]